jgi:hypothetical protein
LSARRKARQAACLDVTGGDQIADITHLPTQAQAATYLYLLVDLFSRKIGLAGV